MRWPLIGLLMLGGCAHLEYDAPQAAGYTPTVPVTVAYIPRADLSGVCRLTPDRLVGCSLLYHDRCEIYVADDLRGRLRREVVAHEEAHCGGWQHG